MANFLGILMLFPNAVEVDTASPPTLNSTLADSFLAIKCMLTDRLNSRFNVPPNYYRESSNILLQYEPFQIIAVDEIFQSITVSCTVTLKWRDYNVGWDPTQFHGIEMIDMPANLFWTPTVLIPKTTQRSSIQIQIPTSLHASHEGYVTAVVRGFTYTLCNLNMAKFPFDSHNCTIIFVERDQHNITAQVSSPQQNNNLGTNAAWMLLGYGCSSTKVHSYMPRFYYVTCYVQVRRRSAFYVANLLTPIVLTSMMTLLVFWIPAETEEKISFLVSMFTSSSVFLNYMIDMIPRSVEVLPQLNLLVLAIQVQIILATAATAFVLRRYKKEQQQESQLSRQREILRLLGRRARQKPSSTQTNEHCDLRVQSSCKPRRKNSIHPEPTWTNNAPHFSNPRVKTGQFNSFYISDIADPLAYDSCQKEIISQNEAQELAEDRKPNRRNRILTHKQLDTLFFAVLLALTIAVYLLVFLRT
ncbi:hypothetical protein BsWGS_18320 [Bradybaena similaris]